jgi:hypothetical protein
MVTGPFALPACVEEPGAVARLADIAAAIRDQALAQATAELDPEARPTPVSERFQQPGFAGRFLAGLRLGVARELAAYDRRVLAVYADGQTPGPDCPPAGRLLVLVTAPSAALDAFEAALDRSLAASLAEWPAPGWLHQEPLLAFAVVTEVELQLGLSLAGGLDSAAQAPVPLWQRARTGAHPAPLSDEPS